MKNNFWGEITISLVLIFLLILLLNPLGLSMSQSVQMMLTVGLAVIFIVFATFVWKEKAADERESLHRYIAARFAYLAGTAILIVGVIIQSFNHLLDFWLIFALAVMIFAKIIGRIYSQFKH